MDICTEQYLLTGGPRTEARWVRNGRKNKLGVLIIHLLKRTNTLNAGLDAAANIRKKF